MLAWVLLQVRGERVQLPPRALVWALVWALVLVQVRVLVQVLAPPLVPARQRVLPLPPAPLQPPPPGPSRPRALRLQALAQRQALVRQQVPVQEPAEGPQPRALVWASAQQQVQSRHHNPAQR